MENTSNNNDNNKLNFITSLTTDEQEKVKEILNEINTKGKSDTLDDLYYDGKSDTLDDLYYDDYEEIPVDINTFLDNPLYLGNYTNNGKDIYET